MSSDTVEVKKNPTITAVIDGPIVNITERTPSGVIAQRTVSVKEFFESVGEIYKPYHLEKSPYFQVHGANWSVLRFWQHNTDGTVTVVVESTPRLYDMQAERVGALGNGEDSDSSYWGRYVKAEYEELKGIGRLDYDRRSQKLTAKLHMPYTVLVTKLVPKSSDKNKDMVYRVGGSAIMFSDKPTTSLASEVYSIPLPNTYCFPYRSNTHSPICWGNALDKMEFSIESSPIFLERFYGSKFNNDLVSSDWYARALPYFIKGPDFVKTEKYPKVMTQAFIKAGNAIKPTGDSGSLIDTKSITVGKIIELLNGSHD